MFVEYLLTNFFFCFWISRISDEISEELIAEVEKEVEDLCDEYVEEVYKQEFLKNDSISTDVSVGDKTL